MINWCRNSFINSRLGVQELSGWLLLHLHHLLLLHHLPREERQSKKILCHAVGVILSHRRPTRHKGLHSLLEVTQPFEVSPFTSKNARMGSTEPLWLQRRFAWRTGTDSRGLQQETLLSLRVACPASYVQEFVSRRGMWCFDFLSFHHQMGGLIPSPQYHFKKWCRQSLRLV